MTIQTTPEYWDCECEHNYIHYKTQPTCEICDSEKDDQLESIINEVIILLKERLDAIASES